MVVRPAQRKSDVEYTVQAVADRLGIATPTLRSWNRRYGIGPSGHQPGKHRQYTEADIARLVLMTQLIRAGATPASAARAAASGAAADPLPDPADLDAALMAAFRLDTEAVRSTVAARLARDGVCRTWEELCRPLFAGVLERRTNSDQCIDVEHCLSNAVSGALHQVRRAGIDGRPPVLLACTNNETHTLALEALRAALAERGRATSLIGGAVPPSALAAAMHRNECARTVVLWSQRRVTAHTSVLRRALRTATTVVAAGPGWTVPELPEGVLYVNCLDEAVRLVDASGNNFAR